MKTKLKHAISIDQFDIDIIQNIFGKASVFKYSDEAIKANSITPLAGKIVANLFYEPSTRTSSSFFSAVTKLGGTVLPINEVNYSSVAKGESLTDTIKTLECYVDAIVLRHPEKGSAQVAASISNATIINAGDGAGEHPTQALLDLFTIFSEQKTNNIERLKIGMVGDLKFGRTVHSLTKLLRLYGCDLYFIAPDEFQIPEELTQTNDTFVDNINEVINDLDVLYVTRIQKERHSDAIDYSYIIAPNTIKDAKQSLTIMHPLPRVGEIHTSVDDDPRAAYFRQMKNGLWIRMALLTYLLDN